MTPDSKPESERLAIVFSKQKAAALADPDPGLSIRLARIATLKQMLIENRERFQDSLATDFGSHSPILVDMMETGPVIARVSYTEENLQAWMEPKKVNTGIAHGSSRGEILQVPKGVMGNIAPWNFPVESALVMCTDMLAAGNRVIVKPSELSPATAELLNELVSQYFDPEVLSIIPGDENFGREFASMKWDHLTFTGSSRVGRLVMQAAAENLVPVTLELGGKNPTIFAEDGVTSELVSLLLSFKNLKSGQVCTSPDTVFVPESLLEEWIGFAQEFWQTVYNKTISHPDTTGIINQAHYDRVNHYLVEARARNVRLVSLSGEESDADKRQIPLTLIINPPDDASCLQEEVFGPVIPVVSYQSMDVLFARINAGPTPLASYLVTYNQDLVHKFVHGVRSGGAAINNFGIQGGHVALPFGGVGHSGHGCHSGHEGFLNYSHTKSIFYGERDSHVHQALTPPIHKDV